MTSSKWIAGLLGPTMIAIGAALLINLGSMNAMVAQVVVNIGKIRCRPGKAARGVHHLHGVCEIGIGK